LIAWALKRRAKMPGLMKITKDSCRRSPQNEKKTLLEAQRAWIKFRDVNCRFYYDPDGGTAALLAGNGCFLQATADRAKELKNLTNDQ
jgi:uncharacterized protein YecT (DUF1311 family)